MVNYYHNLAFFLIFIIINCGEDFVCAAPGIGGGAGGAAAKPPPRPSQGSAPLKPRPGSGQAGGAGHRGEEDEPDHFVPMIESNVPGQSLNELLGAIFGNYHKELVPKRPTTVKMDLLLLKVKSTIEKEGIFESVVALFIEWQDDRLLWNPRDYDNVSILAFDSDKVWLPDIAMTNSADHLYSISKDTRFVVRVSHDGAMKFVPTGTARTWCDLKLLTFPFDIQTCSLEFESWSLDSSTMTFNRSSDALVDDAFASPQWALCKRQAIVYDHYYNFTGETFTRVRFDFIVRRKSTFYIINLIFPCATLSLIQLLVFVIPSTDSTSDRVGFGTTNLLTLVVFQTIVTEEMIIISAVGIFESVIAERMLRTTASPPPYWASKLISVIPMLWSSQLPTGITQMILEGEFEHQKHNTGKEDNKNSDDDTDSSNSNDSCSEDGDVEARGGRNTATTTYLTENHANNKQKASVLVSHRPEDNTTKSSLVTSTSTNKSSATFLDRPKTLQLKAAMPNKKTNDQQPPSLAPRPPVPVVRIFDVDRRDESFIFTSLNHRIDKTLHIDTKSPTATPVHYSNDTIYNPNLLSVENTAYYQTIPPQFPPLLPPPPRYSSGTSTGGDSCTSAKNEMLENTANDFLLMMMQKQQLKQQKELQQQQQQQQEDNSNFVSPATARPDDLLLLGFSPGSTTYEDGGSDLLLLESCDNGSSVNIKQQQAETTAQKEQKPNTNQPPVVAVANPADEDNDNNNNDNNAQPPPPLPDDANEERARIREQQVADDVKQEARKSAQRDQLLRIKNGRLWGVLVTRLDSLTFTICTLLAVGIPLGLFVPLVLSEDQCPLLHDGG